MFRLSDEFSAKVVQVRGPTISKVDLFHKFGNNLDSFKVVVVVVHNVT